MQPTEGRQSYLFYHLSDEWATHVLAFVGGFVGSAGFHVVGVFTASITGTLIQACACFFVKYGSFHRIVTVSSSFLGSFIASAIEFHISRWADDRKICCLLFSIEMAFLLLATVYGMLSEVQIDLQAVPNMNDPRIIIIGAFLGFSMGVHTAITLRFIDAAPSTTAMTHTVAKVAGAISFFP